MSNQSVFRFFFLFVTMKIVIATDVIDTETTSSVLIKKFFSKGILSHLMQGGKLTVEDPSSCFTDIRQLVSDLQHTNVTGYALRMLDSEGKPPSGILNGNLFWPGEYNECLSVHSPRTNVSSVGFSGQYCLLHLSVQVPAMEAVSLHVGSCLPNSCGNPQVEFITMIAIQHMKTFFKNIGIIVAAKVVSARCEEKEELSTGGKAIISVLVIFITTVFIGTALDISLRRRRRGRTTMKIQSSNDDTVYESTENTWLLGNDSMRSIESKNAGIVICMKICSAALEFSLMKTYSQLVSRTTRHGYLSCLDGLRVLSMWWIILGHSYVAITYDLANLLEVKNIVRRLSFQAVPSSSFAVDTFFFLSGLLMTLVTLRRMTLTEGKVKWSLFLLHRLLRLTPVYAVILFMYAYLSEYAAQGPLGVYLKQNKFVRVITNCKTKWWTNLLFINNFYPQSRDLSEKVYVGYTVGNIRYTVGDKPRRYNCVSNSISNIYLSEPQNTCMPWSWYLANDLQFYVISPFIMVLLYRHRKISLSVIVSLILGSIFIRGFIISYYDINFFSEFNSSVLYVKPYARVSSFLVGVLIGYTLQRIRCQWQPKRIFIFTGWTISCTLMSLVVYGPHQYYLDLKNAPFTASLFYGTFSRLTWCIALAWIVFACATGHGGPVNNLLSLRVWEPLGKLTYCTYLVHPIIIFCHIVLAGDIRHYTDIAMTWIYIGNLVVAYGVACAFYLVIEAPVAGLEKLLFTFREVPSPTAEETSRNNVNQLL